MIVRNAGDFFFPLRKTLKLFKENYSPDLLRKIIYAGAHSTSSFENARENLHVLAEIDISASHIQRFVSRIGKEFTSTDDYCISEVLSEESVNNKCDIKVATVSVDGGRAQKREEDCGPGVHNPAWVETKVAALQVMESIESAIDPHPTLPKAFKDQKTVQNLVEGLKGYTTGKTKENDNNKDSIHLKRVKAETDYRPKVINKFVVATVDTADDFGKLLFNKVNEQQLYTAERKAFLGDGDRKIWTIYEDNFKADGWIPILDFVHAVEYAYDAAKLTTETTDQCWVKYIKFTIHIWQGRVLTVIRRLDKFIEEINSKKRIPKALEEKAERLVIIRNYFKNNYNKMNYPTYRKKGLPVSSCHVESLIKQLNIRVKSSDKFWNVSSLKCILKLKASLLSDDNSWQDFWRLRYERQNNSKRKYFRKAA